MTETFGALTPNDFGREYGYSKSATYRAIRAGDLRAVKAGTKTLILRRDAEAFLDSLPAIQPKASRAA